MIVYMLTKYKGMKIKAIKTEEDYIRALNRLEKIFHAPENTDAEVLSILIENLKMSIIQ
jgi:antitoxin component HigA of HigAB toxin-antitoxin module